LMRPSLSAPKTNSVVNSLVMLDGGVGTSALFSYSTEPLST
jgi:hypothetical protein